MPACWEPFGPTLSPEPQEARVQEWEIRKPRDWFLKGSLSSQEVKGEKSGEAFLISWPGLTPNPMMSRNTPGSKCPRAEKHCGFPLGSAGPYRLVIKPSGVTSEGLRNYSLPGTNASSDLPTPVGSRWLRGPLLFLPSAPVTPRPCTPHPPHPRKGQASPT